jgi:peptide/nickel transport system substrate-binding protein
MCRRKAVATLLLLLIGCARTPAPDRLRVGADVDAGSLDPRLMRDTTSYRVVDLVYDGLVRLDGDLVPRPALASRWESPEPTRFVFHLRENVRFHDGSALGAEDVVHTFESVRDPELGAPLRALYEPIASIEALDDRTVELRLREPYAPLLQYLDLGIVPRHGSDLGSAPVGSGPYRLASWARGSRILLEANPEFWGEPPLIEAVEIVVVPDNTARARAFEAGDLDLVQSPLSPADVHRLASDERFRSHSASGLAITYLNFNTARKPFQEPGLRRALAMLVDQSTILEKIYEGVDEKASSILLPGSWAFDPSVRQPGYDPGAAGELLAALGFRDSDGDGFLDREGRKLRVELGTHSEDVNRVQTVELLQNAFRARGIDASVRISDWPSFSIRRDAGDFDVLLLGWTQLVDPDRGAYDQFHSGGGLNWGGYRNPRVDELLERGRAELDAAERAAIYRELAAIVASELPYYVLSYQGYHVFHSPRLEGFEPDPRGMLRSLAAARLSAVH